MTITQLSKRRTKRRRARRTRRRSGVRWCPRCRRRRPSWRRRWRTRRQRSRSWKPPSAWTRTTPQCALLTPQFLFTDSRDSSTLWKQWLPTPPSNNHHCHHPPQKKVTNLIFIINKKETTKKALVYYGFNVLVETIPSRTTSTAHNHLIVHRAFSDCKFYLLNVRQFTDSVGCPRSKLTAWLVSYT